ncbi:MAG: MarR family transcriptional regulator [Vicinamibacteria bacterium]
MTSDPPIELGTELEFLSRLWTLDHALQKRSKKMLTTIGVTGPQRLALRLIGRFPGLTAGRLARLLHLHPSTVTGVMQRLAERGLIVRRNDGPDRRRLLLQITSKGAAVLADKTGTIEEAVHESLRALTSVETTAVFNTLDLLARRL